MLYATMPKTTINKYHEMFVAKNEIWFAEDILISSPTFNFISEKN
jgi:hypothetical protein